MVISSIPRHYWLNDAKWISSVMVNICTQHGCQLYPTIDLEWNVPAITANSCWGISDGSSLEQRDRSVQLRQCRVMAIHIFTSCMAQCSARLSKTGGWEASSCLTGDSSIFILSWMVTSFEGLRTYEENSKDYILLLNRFQLWYWYIIDQQNQGYEPSSTATIPQEPLILQEPGRLGERLSSKFTCEWKPGSGKITIKVAGVPIKTHDF